MVSGLAELHISVGHMDTRSWVLFVLILAPALLLFVWTAVKVQRDEQEAAGGPPDPSPDDWRAWDESL